MQVIQTESGLIKAWIDGVQLEDAARQQLINLANLPFVSGHVAAMPDVHHGAGATIGSVFGTIGAVIPAAVGVDIGCGMSAVRTSLTASDLPDNLFGIRTAIEAAVPHGRTHNGGPGDRGAWGSTPDYAALLYTTPPKEGADSLRVRLDKIVERHPKITQASERAHTHIGTLGTGNHFVEICLDKEDAVWIMLHSGSRGIGNRIGSYFIELAKKDMKKWFVNLPDQDLAYFPEGTDHFRNYIEGVYWAQEFAALNRKVMMAATIRALTGALPGKPFVVDEHAVNCHHNYVSWERHAGKQMMLTRKGAVSLADGRLGIIPGSMGARSFIVRGKQGRALAESYCSCSHGAGRAMSRTEAKRRFTIEDHIAATRGVECRKDEEVIDETPMAYKDIDAVMAAQADHVEIVHELKQIICVKG